MRRSDGRWGRIRSGVTPRSGGGGRSRRSPNRRALRRRRALRPVRHLHPGLPGPLLRKAWFIPAGIALLHFANVVRVIVLARIQATSPEWLEFNHDYTFTVLIYGLVFALWYLWTVLGRPARLTHPSNPAAPDRPTAPTTSTPAA